MYKFNVTKDYFWEIASLTPLVVYCNTLAFTLWLTIKDFEDPNLSNFARSVTEYSLSIIYPDKSVLRQ